MFAAVSPGHISLDSFPELMRITKKGEFTTKFITRLQGLLYKEDQCLLVLVCSGKPIFWLYTYHAYTRMVRRPSELFSIIVRFWNVPYHFVSCWNVPVQCKPTTQTLSVKA